jgi:hypothetical protein
MSLNKTLDRLFDEIRREAKRNPEFADRLDAVLRLHESRREVEAAVLEATALAAINPAGLYKREGEAGLQAALAAQDLGALRALVIEHNLDPSGITPTLTRDELAAHVLAQAKARAERDEKMFEY